MKEYPVKNMLSALLKDKTTKKNIIFATDAYADYDVDAKTQMTERLILGSGALAIQPRVLKSMEEQSERTKKKAEVFTPSWICNKMNNHCDEEWFGRTEVFNREVEHKWVINTDKIEFEKQNDWKKYVDSKRLEITCGEAPYIVSRYDTTTAEIIPIRERIGILDRKLRVVNENTDNENEWLKWCIRAFQSVYGYEFQGDNLLIARINLLMTFVEYMNDRWGHNPDDEELKKITNVNSAFSAIASGAFHFSDIQSKSHIESSPILSDTLDKLLKMDLVEYVTPINKKGNKMKSGYVISDSSTKFYYHYIHRNSNEKEIMSDDIFYDAFIKDDFEKSYVPKAFEKIAREYLIRKNKEGKINPVLEDIGTYWYDDPKNKINGQFDVVARNREGYLFYEVKFTSKPLTDSLIKEEVEQVNSTSLKAVKYGFISRSGFDLKEEYPYEFLGLTDIYY